MEMKVNAKRIRDERQSRAWSQEHLATITGLGLRTIQRIENSGGASNESITAIASVMSIPVDQLIVPGEFKRPLADVLLARRLWVLVGCMFLSMIVAPPRLSEALAGAMGMWILFEITIATVRWKNIHI